MSTPTNSQLLAELELCNRTGNINPALTNMLLQICENLIGKSPNTGKEFQADMIEYAHSVVCDNWCYYDPWRSKNPYAYFSVSITNAFAEYIQFKRVVNNMKVTITLSNESNTDLVDVQKAITNALLGIDYVVHGYQRVGADFIITVSKSKFYRLWLDKSGNVNVLNNPTDRSYSDIEMPKDPRFTKWMSEWIAYSS